MRLLQLLTASLLPFVALGASKKASGDRFQDFHAQSLSSAPLKIDDSVFTRLTTTPRDYAVAVLLTALKPQFGCAMCHSFQPEWDLLASSWIKGDKAGESRIVFATLDFIDGKQTFQSLGLQTAPVLLIYHPTRGPNAKTDPQPVKFDFSSGPQTAEQIQGWISRHLPEGPKPRISRPLNYVRIASVTVSVLGVISFIAAFASYIVPLVQNRNLWAAISLIAILMFTSGHMFNRIRNVPYVAQNQKGGISYITGGFQNQLGMESQIVAVMYGVLSFAAISVALKVPRIADAKKQQFALFVWVAVIFAMYSFLLSVFRIKNSGYPFWLPPF